MDTTILENLQTLWENNGIIETVTAEQQGLIVADICKRAMEEIERLNYELAEFEVH